MREIIFEGKILRLIFESEDYKMYAVDVDKDKYPYVKFTKFKNATICGNLHSLSVGCDYRIKAIEKNGNKGYIYKVVNIRKTDLKNVEDVYSFLQEILTYNQASELYKNYPNIVDLIIDNKDDEIDISKLKGINKKSFELIKTKIIENYALSDLISEFHGIFTLSILKKIYKQYPSVESIRIKLKEDPYKTLCGLSGVGFKIADKLLYEANKNGCATFESRLLSSKSRCMACILYFLGKNEEEGNTKMSLLSLKKKVEKLTPACSNYFVDCIKENDSIWYDKNTLEVALMRTYKNEENIAYVLKNALKHNIEWNINYLSYKDKGDFVLSDQQLNALKNICKYSVSILCGYAGSGKTSTTNTLIKMLKDNNKTFILCTPTGRAAKVLEKYTGEKASTIHRALGYIPNLGWSYCKECKLKTDIVIIDEASMCDLYLFSKLLDAIDFEKTKLFIIGDPAQLCSVGAGNILNDMIESNQIPTIMLTNIFRYSEGGLMKVATDTRNRIPFLPVHNAKKMLLGNNKDYVFIPSEDNDILNNLKQIYQYLLSKYNLTDIIVLTSQNKGDYGTIHINNILQKVANPKTDKDPCIKIGDTCYYEGDVVIQTANNYDAKCIEQKNLVTMIANGEIGVIKKIISPLKIEIEFNNHIIEYDKGKMSESLNLGYCITTHKSQGGSAKAVIFISPNAHTFMLNSNLIYVALTRTKERCFHIGNPITINRAVKKNESKKRKTFLVSMLKND